MKLFYSPIHDFIHKSVVVAEEVGLWDRITEVAVYPRRDGYSIAAINPLSKVPTLVREDGTVLFGSQTIAEYLDSISANGVRVYPASGEARWDALRRLAMADIFFDVSVRMGQERLPEQPGSHVIAWNWKKIVRTLDAMDRDAATARDFDIGCIGTLQALTYFERQCELGWPEPGPAGGEEAYDWRDGRPALAAWFAEVTQRSSVANHYKQPLTIDDSPAFCQAQVAEVLRWQGRGGEEVSSEVDFVAPESRADQADVH